MRLNQIRDFVAVIETGSLRAAARSLGLSQPAITKSIQQLEAELHVQLLQRNARGAAATRAGTAFLARARAIQAELRRVDEDLAGFRGGISGAVAFGIAPAACMLIVPDAVTQFRRRFPHGAVRIVEGVTTALLPQVRDGTLDFLVGQRPLEKPTVPLRFKPLFRTPLVVIGRQGHPLRKARSLRELLDAPWLMFYRPNSGATLARAFAAAGLPMPRDLVQCESYAAALALLSKTNTLGLLIPQMIAEPYAERHLLRIDVQDAIPGPVVGMYTRADAPLTAAATEMAHAVNAVAGRLAARR